MSKIRKHVSKIAEHNPLLATEIAKLPELQGDMNNDVLKSLKNLTTIYKTAPEAVDRFFNQIYSIGRHEDREYCTPLQAIFWLIQDNKFEDIENILEIELPSAIYIDDLVQTPKPNPGLQNQQDSNILQKLLDAAWHVEPPIIPEKQIHEIVDGIRLKSEVGKYNQLARPNDTLRLQNYIFKDFKKDRNIFKEANWAQIYQGLDNSRWQNFFTVADRLNAPELLDYYIKNNFTFRKTASNGVYMTFYFKQAQCTDAAYFAKYMLEQAGYNAFIRSVKWSPDPWDGLHTGAGIIQNDGSYTLVANYTGINTLSGPHKSIADLDSQLAGDHKIIDQRWGAYYPPCYY